MYEITKKLSDVLNYVDDETLLILDVDNTLMEPKSFAGSVAWFKHASKKLTATGLSEKEVVGMVYPAWLQLQESIEMKTVEDDTVVVLDKIYDKNVKVMGLTGRGFVIAKLTCKQLNSVGISLDKNTIYHKELVLDSKTGFYGGILSVEPYANKAEKLLKFFDKIDFAPKRIVFVDDEKPYVEGFHKIMSLQDIPFTCLYYKGAEKQFTSFEPAKAAEELRAFFNGTEYEELVKSLI